MKRSHARQQDEYDQTKRYRYDSVEIANKRKEDMEKIKRIYGLDKFNLLLGHRDETIKKSIVSLNPADTVDSREWKRRLGLWKKVLYSLKPDAMPKYLPGERETNQHRLAQRQKQIDYGKNTVGYDEYIRRVPKHTRDPRKRHLSTPDKYEKMSKRNWEGNMRVWRAHLHEYDPKDTRPVPEPIKEQVEAPVVEEVAIDTTTEQPSIYDGFEEEQDEDDLL